MAIKKTIFFATRLVIDFRYQLITVIDCHRLSSTVIDYRFHRLIRPGPLKQEVKIGRWRECDESLGARFSFSQWTIRLTLVGDLKYKFH